MKFLLNDKNYYAENFLGGEDNLKKIMIFSFCVCISLILFSCDKNNSENKNLTEIYSNTSEYFQIPSPHQLSDTLYPEWIFLSENFHNSAMIYSPIDHDYNIKRAEADFIDGFTGEFIDIWRQEMEFQYDKCIQNMPKKFKEQFIKQQSSWEDYMENNIFPEIAPHVFITDNEDNGPGYGFIREADIIYLDKIRTRTIEIMRCQIYIDGINAEFQYKSIYNNITQ